MKTSSKRLSAVLIGTLIPFAWTLAASEVRQISGQCDETGRKVVIELSQATDYFSYHANDDTIVLALPNIRWDTQTGGNLAKCEPLVEVRSRRRHDNLNIDLLFTAPGLYIDKINRTFYSEDKPLTLEVTFTQRRRHQGEAVRIASMAPAGLVATTGQTVGMKAVTDSQIKRVRIGEHPTYTRVVLDLSAATTYRIEQDGDDIVVLLPDAAWQPAHQMQRVTSPHLAGYSFENQQLRLQSAKPLTLLRSFTLQATEVKDHRLVLDLSQ